MTKRSMSSLLRTHAVMLAVSTSSTCVVAGGGDIQIAEDVSGDATARWTTFGSESPLGPEVALPDITRVMVCGWMPTDALADPYEGVVVGPRSGHIVRVQVEFAGLVNPPGTIGSGGAGVDPYQYGPRPVFGYIEINADNRRGTGGELGTSATTRYLANVARFGALPDSSISDRAARSGLESDYDSDFCTEPFYERSGTDFELSLCGCFPSVIVSESGNCNGVFEAGETMIVRGRFFQRAGGYREASAVFGGSEPQAYDPLVNVRFRHSLVTDRTTIELVYALDMEGAAILTGEPEQAMDCLIDIAGSHSSVAEAMQDVINGARGLNGGPLSGPVATLANEWAEEESPDRATELDRWRVSALVGTAAFVGETVTLVWTDVGFAERAGDLNSDGVVDELDAAIFDARIDVLDGSWRDGDGQHDGTYVIEGFAANFDVLDLDYDGIVGELDRALIVPRPVCEGDFNHDDFVNSQDFFDFLGALFEGVPAADVNADGFVNSQDFFDFIVRFFSGC